MPDGDGTVPMPAEEAAEPKGPTAMLTVKSVPLRTRETMNRLARKRGQTVGHWLTELVERAEQLQAGDLVEPGRFDPQVPAPTFAGAAAAAEGPGQVTLTAAELAQLVEVAELTGSAHAKRLARGLVADYLRLARASVRAVRTGPSPRPLSAQASIEPPVVYAAPLSDRVPPYGR